MTLIFIVLISLLNCLKINAFTDFKFDVNNEAISHTFISDARNYYAKQTYDKAIKSYKQALAIGIKDSVSVYKELSFSYIKSDQPLLACKYIHKYIHTSLDVSFVGHSYFDALNGFKPYDALKEKYLKKVDFWAIFCFYVGFIGFFIAGVLNLRKKSDKVANLLMSGFVFMHSFFMIHISLRLMNHMYYLPHSLYMSTVFSFLYGPLIYFYFKRVTTKYKFKKLDIIHSIPTLLLVGVLVFSVYNLSANEKLRIIIHNEYPYVQLIAITKLILLLIYGSLVIKMYLQSIKENRNLLREVVVWQRNIVVFCSIYIVSYAIYATLILQYKFSGFLFYVQILAMGVLVLYVSYTAFVQPAIFGSLRKDKPDELGIRNHSLPKIKYEKSGLTPSLSQELKNELISLLNEDKIYKQNDITLQKLSELLDTTRHNTSQIINEHFGLNFFELINKYRIEEAKELLIKGEKLKNFTIIDVAYEVGFNNKVTFNKSFKKYNHVTPSEYIKSFVA